MRVVLGCGNFGGIGSSPAFFGQGETREQAFDADGRRLGARPATGSTPPTPTAAGAASSGSATGSRATGNRPRITSKTFNAMEDGADSGSARDRVLRQVETSLERLGVERIDLYLTHEPDPDTPVEETFATFADARSSAALIGAWGISNVGADDLREWLALGTPALVQNSYSLLDRGDEREVIPLCAEHGIEYQAFSPLAGGWLTGKYRRGEEPPAGSRMTMRPEPYRHLETRRGLRRARGARAEAPRSAASAPAGSRSPGRSARVGSVVVGPRRPDAPRATCARRSSLSLSPAERDEVGSLFPCVDLSTATRSSSCSTCPAAWPRWRRRSIALARGEFHLPAPAGGQAAGRVDVLRPDADVPRRAAARSTR